MSSTVVPSWSAQARTSCAEGTRRVAGALAQLTRGGDLILLVGELGAGKTVFAQGFAAGLGIDGPVTSPTFALLRQYPCEGVRGIKRLLHADLYRLDTLNEVIDLAVPEMLEDESVALVEWGDVAARVLGRSYLAVSLDQPPMADGTEGTEGTERHLTLMGMGPDWQDRRSAIEAALGSAMTKSSSPRRGS